LVKEPDGEITKENDNVDFVKLQIVYIEKLPVYVFVMEL